MHVGFHHAVQTVFTVISNDIFLSVVIITSECFQIKFRIKKILELYICFLIY